MNLFAKVQTAVGGTPELRETNTAKAIKLPLIIRLWRLIPSRLASRIILLNIAGLAVLVLGILYFAQFRQGLIEARVEALKTQAQIIAAAIAGNATVDTGSIVIDPETLYASPEHEDTDLDTLSSMDFPIKPETTGPVLRRLINNTYTRAWIIDTEGYLLIDSHFLWRSNGITKKDLQPPALQSNQLVYYATQFWDWIFANRYEVQREYGIDNGKDFPEINYALQGMTVNVVKLNEKRQTIVLVATPIQRFRAVLGVLVLSTTGDEIERHLRSERHVVLLTFSLVALVTIVLSLLLAGTIARPMRKLAAAAEQMSTGVNKRIEIPDFTKRRDEIGDLSGSLRHMTNALYSRIDAIEAFAADVSHELKNPLTSLRSAVETLPYVKKTEQRSHLYDIVKQDVRRLDRLITDISNASRLDAELARAQGEVVDMAQLLEAIVSLSHETNKADHRNVRLTIIRPAAGQKSARQTFQVWGHDSRLAQIFSNLIDNACSFSPENSTVDITLRRVSDKVEIIVDDQGCGINPDNFEHIFDRFYTDRPAGSFGKNSGLGLSISRQIVQAHKGKIWAENRYSSSQDGSTPIILGARFFVHIPAYSSYNEPSSSPKSGWV